MMNKQGRPTTATGGESAGLTTISGHSGLDHEEKLIFELGRSGKCGVDLPEPELKHDRLGGLRRPRSCAISCA
jgi:glycine dehydrogenase subunit 2